MSYKYYVPKGIILCSFKRIDINEDDPETMHFRTTVIRQNVFGISCFGNKCIRKGGGDGHSKLCALRKYAEEPQLTRRVVEGPPIFLNQWISISRLIGRSRLTLEWPTLY